MERDAQEMAENLGVKIFSADIIYHLFDAFLKHRQVNNILYKGNFQMGCHRNFERKTGSNIKALLFFLASFVFFPIAYSTPGTLSL